MYNPIRFFIFLVMLCAIPVTTFALDKLPVFVTIVPQKFFVQQIGKDLVDVQVMVGPGASPHTYEPKPQQMIAIAKAKVYFSIGVEFEKAHLDKLLATNPKLKVIHTDHGIEKLTMATHHHEEHTKQVRHKAGFDPHIWLSPNRVKIQARIILEALQEADPANKDAYAANYTAFMVQLEELDAELKTLFSGKSGLQFLVFHPSWGYFAHDYGLQQIPVEVEGKNPKPAQLKELIEHARKSEITIIFAQPQFSTKDAKVVAKEIGGQVVFADPLAEDWIANLRHIADTFHAALK